MLFSILAVPHLSFDEIIFDHAPNQQIPSMLVTIYEEFGIKTQ